jgi:HK97 family phage major capsid protein
MRLDEIEAELTAVRAQLKELEDNPSANEADDGDAVDTLLARHDELIELAQPLRDRMQKLAAVRSAAHEAVNNERSTPDFGKDAPIHRTAETRDPFNGETQELVHRALLPTTEIRGLALDVIERCAKNGDFGGQYGDDRAEEATRRVQDEWRFPTQRAGEPNLWQMILRTGTPEYREAFDAYLSDPVGEARRAALSLTNTNGGYMLPFVLDPTIVLTNAASANPYRRISNVKTTTSNTWNGVTSAGITAAWLAEGTAASDNTPTVGPINITPLKAAAWLFGSFEVLADTDFGAQLPGLLQDAKDRLEEAAFAVGTGTAQPKGIAVAATTTVSTATTAAYVVGDVYALHAALPPRFRNSPNAAFVANVAQINRTRQLDTAGGASFWTNLGKDSPEQLLGKGIYESSSLSATLTGTNNTCMVFGDFSQYYIVDRVGTSIIYEPMITGTGASANLPTGQSGWFMFWRVGADAAVPAAFRSLRST